MRGEGLCIDNLGAGYGGRPVIEALSLTIPSGQRMGLIGPNGCGKSTLLRAIAAEIPESSGSIFFDSEEITDLETDVIIGRGVGYLRQTHNIFSGLTVSANLEIAAENGRAHASERDVGSVLEAFPVLNGRGAVRAGLMSGGERQALAVAMVLMHRVSLLLLDEPLAGLSQRNAMELLQGVYRLQREEGFSLVLVEHRLKLIRPYVDRAVVMVRGSIAEDTDDTSILENRNRLEKYFLA